MNQFNVLEIKQNAVFIEYRIMLESLKIAKFIEIKNIPCDASIPGQRHSLIKLRPPPSMAFPSKNYVVFVVCKTTSALPGLTFARHFCDEKLSKQSRPGKVKNW